MSIESLWKAWDQTAKVFEENIKTVIKMTPQQIQLPNLTEVQVHLTKALQEASEAGMKLSQDILKAFSAKKDD